MTTEELLQPRTKVIAPYPGMPYEVGQILFPDKAQLESQCEYPHIFKEISWWEERKVEDMPQYVKLVINEKIDFVKNSRCWFYEKGNNVPLFKYINKSSYILTWNPEVLSPATEQEYNTYRSKQEV